MLAYLLAALLFQPCPPLSPAQAQAVAIRFIERRYSGYLASYPPYKTYSFSRQQMQAYAREGSRVESGYLVMYALRFIRYHPHGEFKQTDVFRRAVFVNHCRVVRSFEPVRQVAKFKQAYQSGIYPLRLFTDPVEAADSSRY
jgi:hypothetical protein